MTTTWEVMDGPPPPPEQRRPRGGGKWQRFARAVRDADGRWLSVDASSSSNASATVQRLKGKPVGGTSLGDPGEFDATARGAVVWCALKSGAHYEAAA